MQKKAAKPAPSKGSKGGASVSAKGAKAPKPVPATSDPARRTKQPPGDTAPVSPSLVQGTLPRFIKPKDAWSKEDGAGGKQVPSPKPVAIASEDAPGPFSAAQIAVSTRIILVSVALIWDRLP